MIEIIKELDVEVSRPNIFQAIVAKQYDMNTRFLKVTFKDGGTRIDIPYIETAKVVINANRPDGQSKGFDGVVNEDGTVTVPLHSWMLELDGTVICDISVMDTAVDDNKKLTTTSFTLLVEKAAYGGDDVTNDPQYDVLVSLLETCTEASAIAQEALEKSNEANSKYDACVEATENANNAAEIAQQAADGVVTIEKNNQTPLQFWVGTQAEYDSLTEKIGDNCLYIVTDDPVSGDVSEAIANINEEIIDLSSQVDDLEIQADRFSIDIANLKSAYIEQWGDVPAVELEGAPTDADYNWYYEKLSNGIAKLWTRCKLYSNQLIIKLPFSVFSTRHIGIHLNQYQNVSFAPRVDICAEILAEGDKIQITASEEPTTLFSTTIEVIARWK